jgi:hypothetical protein
MDRNPAKQMAYDCLSSLQMQQDICDGSSSMGACSDFRWSSASFFILEFNSLFLLYSFFLLSYSFLRLSPSI